MAHLNIRHWALRGAEQRLVEIAAEAARIYAEFPELRDSGDRASATAISSTEGKPHRPKRRSREARQRMAEAQRKRWAAVRAQNGDNTSRNAAGSAVATVAPKELSRKKK